MEPVIHHLQITVRDMSVAVPFYDQLMPLLGFARERRVSAVIQEHELHVVEYTHPRLAFAISSPRRGFAADAVHRRRPGALHHLAFQADSRAQVDRLYPEIEAIGATIVAAPRASPE